MFSSRRRMKLLLIFISLLVLAYVGICAFLYLNQDRLLFIPAHVTAAELENRASKGGFEPWTSSSGQRLGWKSAGNDAADALVICHGNGGFALENSYEPLRKGKNFQIYLLEYPGYGLRGGKPSTQAFVDTVIDAIDTLHEDRERHIWLMGQSIGSGVVCAAMVARPSLISGIVLVTPFESLGAAAGAHYPWIPVRLLLRHHLDTSEDLESFHSPVAFVIAGKDQVIPPKLAQHLYDDYTGPKRLWVVAGAGHNDQGALLASWPEISAWLRTTLKQNHLAP